MDFVCADGGVEVFPDDLLTRGDFEEFGHFPVLLAVATDDGVPGIPVNIHDINPPEKPPTKTPNIVAKP